MHLGATTEYNRSRSSHSLPRLAAAAGPFEPEAATCPLLTRLTNCPPKLAARQTPPKRRHPVSAIANDDLCGARATGHYVRPAIARSLDTPWHGDVPGSPVSLPTAPTVADAIDVLFDALVSVPRPKPQFSLSDRACLVCHPIREHLVPSPHPTSCLRCEPKSAECTRRTGYPPKTSARLAHSRLSTLRRGSPHHPEVAARYPLHSKAPPASRLVLRVHTACTQSSVSARHRHRPFGLCRRGGHVSAFALSCPRPRPSSAPKHRVLSWPPWRRLRRDTPCSWSKRHTKQPRGWNRRSWTRKPFTVEPSTAGVRGHLPWGPRPSDETSLGDRCAGLPHRHHPLSGFLTLSAV